MKKDSTKDSIYSHYSEKVANFIFDDKVASVFDDMIARSVPGYAAVIAMTSVFAEQCSIENSNLYDLGCSLGASTLAMRKGVNKPSCRIIAVDNSSAMLDKCQKVVSDSAASDTEVEFVLSDIADIQIQNASVVVLNFTLQFLAPHLRAAMIDTIYKGLLPGGVLLLSEKVAYEQPDQQEFQIDMHHHFKRLNGYSDLEISQKRKSLENVLVPDTLKQHEERLKEAGFARHYLWFKCFNFISLVAFKQ